MKRIHALISGVVQGVFFRANTVEVALDLGLKGWVRNLSDGRVEVVAEGDEVALKDFLDWLHKGPPGARVENVKYEWLEPTGEFKTFDRK
jgi:acylphosphatase